MPKTRDLYGEQDEACKICHAAPVPTPFEYARAILRISRHELPDIAAHERQIDFGWNTGIEGVDDGDIYVQFPVENYSRWKTRAFLFGLLAGQYAREHDAGTMYCFEIGEPGHQEGVLLDEEPERKPAAALVSVRAPEDLVE